MVPAQAEHVDAEQRTAVVVHVVGVTVVGEQTVTMALSASGRSAAICSPLNPPQEMPNMPTLPVTRAAWPARR